MNSPRFDYIDGLRGLAILGVVMVHTTQSVKGLPEWLANFGAYGSRGVQLFFMVSALTLLMATSKFQAQSFYTRRFFRIAPMFYLAIPLYLYGNQIINISHFDNAAVTRQHLALTLAFFHGWSPIAINSVVPGGWSIACEAFFYALFPLLFAKIRNARTAVIACGASYIVAMLALALLPILLKGTGSPRLIDDFAHFNVLAHLPAFLAGFVIFHTAHRLHQSGRPFNSPVFWRYATVAISIGIALSAVSGLKILTHALPATFMLAGLVLCAGFSQPRVLTHSVSRHLGTISFSIYILHFFVLSIVRATLQPAAIAAGWSPIAQFALIGSSTLLASAALATATYLLIEKPMIRLGRYLTALPAPTRHRVARGNMSRA